MRTSYSPSGHVAATLGPETRVITHVKEDPAHEGAVLGQLGPTPPAGLIALVFAVPREVRPGRSCGRRAQIHVALDCDEAELSGVVTAELDEGGAEQVDDVGVSDRLPLELQNVQSFDAARL
jgi:hypothetical protein